MIVLKNRDAAVNALAFSPEGDALAAAGYWGYIRVWDVASRSLRFERRAGTANQSVVFFADGRLYSFDSWLYALDAKTGDTVRHPHRRVNMPGILAPAPWPVPCVCVARGGRRSIACYTLADARQSLKRLNSTMEQVEKTAKNVGEGKGVAGKLLNDERLGDLPGSDLHD
jgi:hypothetical protein